MDCIFCKIVAGEIPSKKVYEDDDLYAFHDIQPAAPTHVLLIPKKHVPSIVDIEDEQLAGKLMLGIQNVAQQLGLDKNGFRVVNNMGEWGQQTVHHVHFHLLGGRQLTWPPG